MPTAVSRRRRQGRAGRCCSLLSDWTKTMLLTALIRAAARMVAQMSATCEFFTVITSKDDCASRETRPGVGLRSSPMATSKSIPVKTPASSEGRSARRRPFCRTAMAKSPSKVPGTLPRPPKIDVPPSTTAVIAASS